MRPRFILILALVLVFASCGDDDATVDDAGGETQATEATTAPEPVGEAPTDDGSDDGSSDEAPPPDETPPTDTGLPPLPADPQHIEFEASDGKMLVGHYLPAAMNPAPIVVFGHWAGGDQRDWIEIGPWLQNRLDELPAGWQDLIGPDCGPQREGPWLDPTWFPMHDRSYGVFFFDYRDFCESEPGLGEPSEWALDAQAAMDAAALLEGVDPSRMVAVGPSIGGDGAPDGCVLHNLNSATCVGAFSLSPGNYLIGTHYELTFADTVNELEQADPPNPVWCLAGEDDAESAPTCESASGEVYRMQLYPTDAHAMFLIDPQFSPNPLELLLEFLDETVG